MSGLGNFVDIPSSGEARDNDDVAVDGTTGGVTLLAANQARKSALITNTGAYSMRVTTDGSAPTATHGKLVAPGASLLMTGQYCPTAVVKAIRATSSSTTANASEVT